MQFYTPEPMSVLSRWTSRIALFSLLLVVTAAFLHRLFGMPTPVALTLVQTALLGAAVSLVLGVLATVGIWRTGRAGAARVLLGIVLSLGLISVPVAVFLVARGQPSINDVTTDLSNPPEFVELAKVRVGGANPAVYPTERFSKSQAATFPDLAPLYIDRSLNETYELVREAARRMDFKFVREKPPGEGAGEPGYIEAFDRTLVLGFYDDISIRVSGDEASSRVDLRSASRYGEIDFGANADRLRAFMKEIVVRLEETVPAADGDTKGGKKANIKDAQKPGKEGDQKLVRPPRKIQNPARSDAQRGPERKVRPPAPE